MRRWVLAAARGGALIVSFTTTALATAPGKATLTESQELASPASSADSFFALSLGAAAITDGKAKFRAEGTDGGEGAADGGFIYAISYQRSVLPALALEGFAQRAGWSTELSDENGDGDRAVYDLGVAPTLTLPLSTGRRGVSFLLAAPLSFSLSYAPARAPREAVRERMNLGTGYRFGLSVGWLFRLSRHFAWLIQAEHARQRLSHERTYRSTDGTGREASQSIVFNLAWLSASVGVVFMP